MNGFNALAAGLACPLPIEDVTGSSSGMSCRLGISAGSSRPFRIALSRKSEYELRTDT